MALIRAIKWFGRVAVVVVSIVLTIMVVRAFDARRLPDLQPWHTVVFDEEYRATSTDSDLSLKKYLEREDRLFEALDKKIYATSHEDPDASLNRYVKGSRVYPGRFTRNWNRSYELIPDGPKGGVVLLHGLTDSPYSMRAIAKIFQAEGFYVLVPRLPGHGTTPSALRHATWQDWMAVVKMSVRHVRDVVGDDRLFYLGGYSNGGALAIKYTLESFVDSGLARPNRLFLFSPAIGITRFAALANWHKLLSAIPYFRKFEWASIRPEYDPFKYNSFPKMAGHQSFTLARTIQKQIDELAGQLAAWPPTLTFQSLVDSTVLTRSVIEQFYDKLSAPKNELVLYDVNRINRMQGFSPQTTAEQELTAILSRRALHSAPYTLTVITNRRNDTREVVARTWRGAAKEAVEEPLSVGWPRDVYSLSHVAIPFPPDDPYYGDGRQASSTGIPPLGSLRPRGERNTLIVPLQQLMRLRHNPFFDDMAKRIAEF